MVGKLAGVRCEVIGNCTLYLGDSRQVLPHVDPVDVLITDPPYGLGTPSGTMGKANGHKRAYDSLEDTPEAVVECYVPCVKLGLELANGRGIITPGSAHAFAYPQPQTIGAFMQPSGTGMCHWGRVTMQTILFYGKDPHVGKTIQPITYNLTELADKTINHPCPKPIKAWQWVVARGSRDGETVLDPFMGSGTTGVACVRLGRKFVGIEISEAYFDLACQRIADAYKQPDLFIDYQKQKQEALL